MTTPNILLPSPLSQLQDYCCNNKHHHSKSFRTPAADQLNSTLVTKVRPVPHRSLLKNIQFCHRHPIRSMSMIRWNSPTDIPSSVYMIGWNSTTHIPSEVCTWSGEISPQTVLQKSVYMTWRNSPTDVPSKVWIWPGEIPPQTFHQMLYRIWWHSTRSLLWSTEIPPKTFHQSTTDIPVHSVFNRNNPCYTIPCSTIHMMSAWISEAFHQQLSKANPHTNIQELPASRSMCIGCLKYIITTPPKTETKWWSGTEDHTGSAQGTIAVPSKYYNTTTCLMEYNVNKQQATNTLGGQDLHSSAQSSIFKWPVNSQNRVNRSIMHNFACSHAPGAKRQHTSHSFLHCARSKPVCPVWCMRRGQGNSAWQVLVLFLVLSPCVQNYACLFLNPMKQKGEDEGEGQQKQANKETRKFAVESTDKTSDTTLFLSWLLVQWLDILPPLSVAPCQLTKPLHVTVMNLPT